MSSLCKTYTRKYTYRSFPFSSCVVLQLKQSKSLVLMSIKDSVSAAFLTVNEAANM